MTSIAHDSEQHDSAAVIAPPPLIYLGGVALGFALEAVLPSASLPAGVRWAVIGARICRDARWFQKCPARLFAD